MNKTTMPIKDRKKVNTLLAYLRGKSYRNFLIAKTQLNTALRISDVINLKVSDFILKNGRTRKYLTLEEQKTSKKKIIPLNSELQGAIERYVQENGLTNNDYLFKSRKGGELPITTTQVHRIFQEAGEALGLENFGTHSLRKTWGYFYYKETRNIALIMEVFNHSSQKVTLRYIGITQKEIDSAYMTLKF